MDLEIKMVDIFQEYVSLKSKITEKPPSYLEIKRRFKVQHRFSQFECDEEKRKILDEIQFVEIEHVNSYSKKVKVKLDVRSKTMYSKFKFYPLTRIIDLTSETILLGVDNEGNLWTYQTTKKIVSQDLSKETSLFPSDLIVQRIKNPLKLSPPYSIPSKPNQTNISWLPNEILLEIFDWIGIETDYQIHKSLIQVCKQWRILIIEEYWKKRCEYSRMNFTLNHKQHSIILPISQSLHDEWYSEKFSSFHFDLRFPIKKIIQESKQNFKFNFSQYENKTKFTILCQPFGKTLFHNPFDEKFLKYIWEDTIDNILEQEENRIRSQFDEPQFDEFADESSTRFIQSNGFSLFPSFYYYTPILICFEGIQALSNFKTEKKKEEKTLCNFHLHRKI